jgi:hypothetical protein
MTEQKKDPKKTPDDRAMERLKQFQEARGYPVTPEDAEQEEDDKNNEDASPEESETPRPEE